MTLMMAAKTSKWFAIGATVLLSGLLTYWGILGIGVYGIALFVLTPILIGMTPVILHGRKRTMTAAQAVGLGFITLAVFAIFLLVFAMEGAICIAMAAPLAIPLTWVGALMGHAITKKTSGGGTASLLIALLIIPASGFMERRERDVPELMHVITSIEINASREEVWKHVIEFPVLTEPDELIFKAGIAYPINAEIKGVGAGATRYCNFSTGAFVEPITTWDEPNLLKFDVAENPATMKELSFYDLQAPHLHDYFISTQGQFKLYEQGDKTLLEGTTWYYHNIYPSFYWKLWSSYIIGKIHLRVLSHIKASAEKSK